MTYQIAIKHASAANLPPGVPHARTAAEQLGPAAAVEANRHPERPGLRHSASASAEGVQAMAVRIANATSPRERATASPPPDAPSGPTDNVTEQVGSALPRTTSVKEMAGILADYQGRLPPEVRPSVLHLCARLHNQDTALREVILEDVKLNDAEFAMLLRYLPGHEASHTLNLNGGLLRDDRLGAMLAALAPKANLLSFSAAYNFLSERSSTALGALLEAHPELTHLDVRSNSMRDGGAAALAAAAECHPGLKSLNVAYCGIYQTGATRLREAVAGKPDFILELADNPVHLASPI